MSTSGYILAIDQGTTGTTALAVDHSGKVIGQAYKEITQIYPQPGWVEHDPLELVDTCEATVAELLAGAGISPSEVPAVGITNQRETTIVWERTTGRPVFNAIVWQCRRTAQMCDALIARGLEETVRARTGLPHRRLFLGHQDPLDSGRDTGRPAQGRIRRVGVRHGG